MSAAFELLSLKTMALSLQERSLLSMKTPRLLRRLYEVLLGCVVLIVLFTVWLFRPSALRDFSDDPPADPPRGL
jgi:hypothetical protein